VVNLRPVQRDDYQFMYDMLKERTPEQSISFEMPTWNQHVRFCNSMPYEAWYIIGENNMRVGNIYLTKKCEWGYFIKKEYQNKGLGTEAMREMAKLHPKKYYYANINPANKIGLHLAKNKFGGKLVQYTFRIPKENL